MKQASQSGRIGVCQIAVPEERRLALWYVGLDVHQSQSSFCVLDGNGKVVKRMQVRGHCSKLIDVVEELPRPFVICYEASCGYGYLYDRLRKVARRVVVAHPGQLRLIFRSKKKNDRVDAKKLATLLFLDQVPPVYVPSIDVRSWRSLIDFRHRLVAKRTRAKNGLRSLCRGHGIALPSAKRLWTRKGRKRLAEQVFATLPSGLQRDLLLDELEYFDRRITQVEKGLKTLADGHPGVSLLRSIPGVGPRTAEAIVAYIDKAQRFSRNKTLGSYFGLVPCQDQSAGSNRLGHITQEGPATVRKLLVEAAWQGIRRSAHIRAYFQRVQAADPNRKKVALVATAHYLVRVMHAMLRTGEMWRYDQKEKTAA